MSLANPYLKQAKQYQRQSVETASREQVLIMLYDGAIRFLNKAKQGLANQNMEAFNDNLLKTQRIITEFMSSLDFEVGGDVAVNLYRLYEYLNYRLVQANMHKDVTMIDEVQEHLRQLKSTWEQAIRQSVGERQAIQTASDEDTSEPIHV